MRREAESNVTRLRNHASLVVWCGNNENLMMWQAKWGDKTNHPPRYVGEHLYDKVLPEVLGRLDQERPYIPSSPFGGEDPNGGGRGSALLGRLARPRRLGPLPRLDGALRLGVRLRLLAVARAWREVFRPGRAFRALTSPSSSRRISGAERAIRSCAGTTRPRRVTKPSSATSGCTTPSPPGSRTGSYYSQLNQRDAIRARDRALPSERVLQGLLDLAAQRLLAGAELGAHRQRRSAEAGLVRAQAPARAAAHQPGSARIAGRRLGHRRQRARAHVRRQARASAISLSSGEVLRRLDAELSLSNGERKHVLDLDTSGLPSDTVVVATFAGARATTLIVEPKALELSPPKPSTSRSSATGSSRSRVPRRSSISCSGTTRAAIASRRTRSR